MVELRLSERRLLALLMRRSGKLVPKETIEAALRENGRGISSNAIEALVSRLRKALQVADSSISIETLRGAG